MFYATHKINIIESKFCTSSWRLNEWTQNLMGEEWCDEFHKWAETNLPRAPSMYYLEDKNMIVAHPEIVAQLKEYKD